MEEKSFNNSCRKLIQIHKVENNFCSFTQKIENKFHPKIFCRTKHQNRVK